MTSRILKKPLFSQFSKNLDLSDYVFVYSNGIQWNIIPLNILLHYPIIYDTYYDRFKNKSSDNYDYTRSHISLVFCPYSFSCTIIFDKIKFTNKIKNNSILFKSSNNKLFTILNNHIFNDNSFTNFRTINVQLFKLRNVLSLFLDCKYLINDVHNSPLIDKSYFSNNDFHNKISNINSSFHPKKICFGIKYLSSKSNDYKFSLLIANSLLDYKNYIDEHFSSLNFKASFITPVFWGVWSSLFPSSKIIKI